MGAGCAGPGAPIPLALPQPTRGAILSPDLTPFPSTTQRWTIPKTGRGERLAHRVGRSPHRGCRGNTANCAGTITPAAPRTMTVWTSRPGRLRACRSGRGSTRRQPPSRDNSPAITVSS